MNMPNIDMNQQKEIIVLSADEFDKQYGITGRGRTSEYDVPMFYDAVEIAKKNPNMFVKWYTFSSSSHKQVKSKGHASAGFATKYFKQNGMDNFVATQRKQGNRVEVFIINEQPTTTT
tara:strand:- start:173 stop:526 length:354 start_codon:yes stop_codon:yes gene_type:complete